MNTKPSVALHLTNKQKENLPLWMEESKKLQEVWKTNIDPDFGIRISIDQKLTKYDDSEMYVKDFTVTNLTHDFFIRKLINPLFVIQIEGQAECRGRTAYIDCLFGTNGCEVTIFQPDYDKGFDAFERVWNYFVEKYNYEKFKEPDREMFSEVETLKMIQDWTRFILESHLEKPATV